MNDFGIFPTNQQGRIVQHFMATDGERTYFRASPTKFYRSLRLTGPSAATSFSSKRPEPGDLEVVKITAAEYRALVKIKIARTGGKGDTPSDSWVYNREIAADTEARAAKAVDRRRTDAMIAEAAAKPAKPAKPAKAPKAPKPERAAKPERAPRAPRVEAAPKPLSAKAQRQADCEAGIVPPAPDFSAATHKPYRGRLAALTALIEAGDIAGLEAVQMLPPRSTSPKALDRYRTGALIALRAKAAKASE